MKKYLMSLAAVALVGSAFVSCSKSEDVFSVTDQLKNQKQAYTQAFVARYGQPAANHTWGFGTTRSVDVNGNLWESQPDWTEAERNAVYDYVNRLKKDIPAGTYTEEDPTNLKNFFVTQIWGGKQDDPNCLYLNIDQIRQQKAGRTYQDSEKIWGAPKMNHLCISKDATRLGTGVAAVDAANWDHANNFNRADNTDWGGNTMYVDWGSLNFAYLSSEDSKYHDKWIIVDGKYITDADGITHTGQYYVCFDFISTNPNLKTKFRMKYPNPDRPTELFERGPIMVQGEFTTVAEAAGIEVEVDGKKFTIGQEGTEWWIEGYDGDANMSIPANDYYTDWIVRLVEAKPKNQDQTKVYTDRVICEDLGTADDFDFNDVAFDIRYADGGAYVKVISVGGIYPLTVAGHEVHQLCGQQADAKGFYRIAGEVDLDEFFVSGATTAADIDIYVTYIDGTADSGSATFELRADAGQVPQKIKVTPSYKLCSERQNIEAKYPQFKNYVQDQTVEWY